MQENIMRNFTAYIERDNESGMYIGSVPFISGAHTQAETLDELYVKLKEVTELCLEEMDEKDLNSTFVGLIQI